MGLLPVVLCGPACPYKQIGRRQVEETITLNLTFLGTLGVAFLIFFGLFLIFITTTLAAVALRLLVITVMALLSNPSRHDTVTHHKNVSTAERGPRLSINLGRHHKIHTVRREPPTLTPSWAAAVAEADARAVARARASAPDIKVTASEMPTPGSPFQNFLEVAPLVQSALHEETPDPASPRFFKGPEKTGMLAILDTGSLVSLSGHATAAKAKQLPANR